MKTYHVYGIGNAMVDIDFQVNLSLLECFNINKGVMTLIDEQTHFHLLKELEGTHHLRACGGSAANTLVTLQQLGGKSFYSCKVGDDEAGDFFLKNLISHGIHTNLQETDLNHREGVTGKCIVLVTPDADRTMNTFLGATVNFSKNQISEIALKNSEYLYIEGYLVAQKLGCEAAISAREMANTHGIKTAITLSDVNMVKYFKTGLCAIIGQGVDILFCNEFEALLFTETNHLQQAQAVLKQYAKTFVITMGGNGAVIYNGNDFFYVKAYQVPVVDTVGAGDVFAGTFLYYITHHYDYLQAGKLASFAASKVVAKFGPRLEQHEINEVHQTQNVIAV